MKLQIFAHPCFSLRTPWLAIRSPTGLDEKVDEGSSVPKYLNLIVFGVIAGAFLVDFVRKRRGGRGGDGGSDSASD